MGRVAYLLAATVVACLMTAQVDSQASSWRIILHEKDQSTFTPFANSLFKGAYVYVEIICKADAGTSGKIEVQWVMEELDCIEDMLSDDNIMEKKSVLFDLTYDELHSRTSTETISHVKKRTLSPNRIKKTLPPSPGEVTQKPETQTEAPAGRVMKVKLSKPMEYDCTQNNIILLEDDTSSPYYVVHSYPETEGDDSSGPELQQEKALMYWYPVNSSKPNSTQEKPGHVTEAWEDGLYRFYLKIQPKMEQFPFTARVRVDMKGNYGHLPAIAWPLLIVRGLLAFVYLALATAWIFIWACAHQHTMKIHMVIGVVAVAAAVANVLGFLRFSVENATGREPPGLKWISMFLTALQTGLTHMLLMIVSTGYGITRPTLSTKILGSASCLAAVATLANFLSFLAMDEGTKIKYHFPIVELVLNIVYTIFLLVVSGWIMIFSIFTYKHLHHRSHSSKKIFSFTIFTITCVVAFVVNLSLTLWSVGFTKGCSKDWRLDWLFSSVSSITALLLLSVLMFLWRPADPTQSYAFSPLMTEDLDAKEGPEEEMDEEEDELENMYPFHEKIPLHPMSS